MLHSTKIEAIRTYLMTCPFLKDGVFGIDYISDAIIEYSIMSEINTNMIVKQYVDGSSLRQYPFSIMSNEDYSPEIISQIEASTFYEDLADWIEEQNRIGNLPDIPGIQSIEIVSPGFLFDAEDNVARYQIQCRILYVKEV